MTDQTIPAGRLHAGHIGMTLRGIDSEGREVHAELRQVYHTSSETIIDTIRDEYGPMYEWVFDANERVSLDGLSDLDAAPPTQWTLYWRTGERQVVEGEQIHTAMNNAGIGAGALAALDFYKEGAEDHGYRWSANDRSWIKRDDD